MRKKIKVTEILPRVIHFKFDSLYDMSSTFIRYQEFYESPKFRDKAFTLAEYMDWYVSMQDDGKFDYLEQVQGIGLPMYSMYDFERAVLGEFSGREEKLMGYMDHNLDEHEYYIIATATKGDKSALAHEVAHGMYYTIPEYQKEVNAITKGVKIPSLTKHINKGGYYHKAVKKDEFHAYLVEGMCVASYLELSGKERRVFKEVSKKLKSINKKHYKENVINKKRKNFYL